MQNRISFAKELIEDIRSINIISKSSSDRKNTKIDVDIKRKIAFADIILVIIDEKSADSASFNKELKIALSESRKKQNKLLIPIIIDNAKIPEEMENAL